MPTPTVENKSSGFEQEQNDNRDEAILSTLSSEPAQEAPDSPIAPASQVSRSPSKGVRAFRQEDGQDFFGRDALVATLITALDTLLSTGPEHPETARLLAVLGPSGLSKAGVVMAGLVPHLQAGAINGSERWVYLDPLISGSQETIQNRMLRHSFTIIEVSIMHSQAQNEM